MTICTKNLEVFDPIVVATEGLEPPFLEDSQLYWNGLTYA